MHISLRPAKLADAQQLLQWRNDELTRSFSHDGDKITLQTHLKWLKRSLENPTRKIYIASFHRVDIGSVRSDFNGEYYELSWMLAPHARGKGLGKKMLRAFVEITPRPMMADIKSENIASQKIAQYLGFVLHDRLADKILRFRLH